MLAILSPAKDMKVLPGISLATSYSFPEFLNEAAGIIVDLKKMEPAELASLMKISDQLALRNFDRFQNWTKEHTIENSSLAIFSFNGEAYRGLRAADFNREELEYAQKVVRVLSGLYGVIRPLDIIQEYRLEMGIRHGFLRKKNLYELWTSKCTAVIEQAIE
jgi:cytoplasmic iron level regulating protein YaaA (DUF328/UPF0246 family)